MSDKYTYSIDFVGVNIRIHRLKKGLTQEDLAELLNVSRTTVSFWEAGDRLPSLFNYFQICFHLDIPDFNLFASQLLQVYCVWFIFVVFLFL